MLASKAPSKSIDYDRELGAKSASNESAITVETSDHGISLEKDE